MLWKLTHDAMLKVEDVLSDSMVMHEKNITTASADTKKANN
jgi:hypothetical protein